jgi:hypothetical protein
MRRNEKGNLCENSSSSGRKRNRRMNGGCGARFKKDVEVFAKNGVT